MDIVKTKSFELAVITRGNPSATKLVIALPGRLDTKDYACFTSHLEYLAEKGFYGVAFDPPGTWESPGGAELFTTTNYIKAVNELITYFGNRSTLLFGHSRGATVAILAGAANQSVTGFVAVMPNYGPPTPPPADALKTGIKISYRDVPPGTTKTKKQKKLELPVAYFIDGNKYDTVAVLRTCKKPKLLFYGTHDKFTTVEEAEKVFATVPEPKTVHKLETDHDYRYHPEIIREVNEVVGTFILS